MDSGAPICAMKKTGLGKSDVISWCLVEHMFEILRDVLLLTEQNLIWCKRTLGLFPASTSIRLNDVRVVQDELTWAGFRRGEFEDTAGRFRKLVICRRDNPRVDRMVNTINQT